MIVSSEEIKRKTKTSAFFLHELEARGKTRFSHTWLAKNRPFTLVLDASTLKKSANGDNKPQIKKKC